MWVNYVEGFQNLNDAISDIAKSGEMDEKPFFNEGLQRVVEISRLRQAPELADQSWNFTSRLKEIGNQAKTRGNFALKLASRSVSAEAGITMSAISRPNEAPPRIKHS